MSDAPTTKDVPNPGELVNEHLSAPPPEEAPAE